MLRGYRGVKTIHSGYPQPIQRAALRDPGVSFARAVRNALPRSMWLKKLITRLAVSIAAAALTAIVLEISIRVIAPQELSGSWRTISERGYLLNKASWESRHALGQRVVRYRFNKFHQRSGEIDDSAFKVLTLGDSFTFGWLLDEDKTYVGLIQRYANERLGRGRIQFLNAAAGGWGLADYRDYLDEFGDSVRPQMVLVYFNSYDIGRSVNRRQFHNPDSAVLKLKKFSDASKGYQALLEHSHLAQLLRNRLDTFSLGQQADAPQPSIDDQERQGAELAKAIFLDLKSWCKERGIPLVILTTGWHFDRSNDTRAERYFLDQADAFFASHGPIPFRDITASVAADMSGRKLADFTIANDDHPNEEGATLIARNSWEFLAPLLAQHFQEWQR